MPPSPKSTVLRHTDSLRLTLTAFAHTFHLHLRPNDALIHPAARITHVAPDGSKTSTPLLRESVLAYWGEVVPAHASPARMRADAANVPPSPDSTLGWARVVVHHQGTPDSPPVFEGAFSAAGIVHHIMTKDNYLRTKHALDPALAHDVDELDSSLVIWRDSDSMTHEEETVASGDAVPTPNAQSCHHDRLPYNTDNAILQKPLNSPWYDPYSILANPGIFPRDDVAAGSANMSTK